MKEILLKSIGATTLLPFAAGAKSRNAGSAATNIVETKALPIAAHTLASRVRLRLVLAGALALIAGLATLPVHATEQKGVSSVPIANGSFDEIGVFAKTDVNLYINPNKGGGNANDFWMAAINTKGPSHLYIVQNTVVPGGTFGWHSHPGPSLVIVKEGTATEYRGDDPTFTAHVHSAGSTFIDAGEATGHLVRNEGNVNLVVVVVRLIPEVVPATEQRISLDPPPNCPDFLKNG